MRSMTGFGEATSEVDGTHYFVEIRSLNNKYFKATIKLPEHLQGLEAELEARLRKLLVRGTITMTCTCTEITEGAAHTINQKALQRYVDQLGSVPAVAEGSLRLDVGALLALPGVLQPPPDEEDRLGSARAVFTELLDRACERLLQMRTLEGETLRTEMISHRDSIQERLNEIARRAPAVVEEYEKRLRERIEQLLSGAEATVQTVDVIREVAVYAERTDIAEEVQRLNGHMGQFTQLLTSNGDRPIGRTLEFLAQEMLREANTIASKSPDSEISRDIVEVKGVIDRIKEQAHNVE